MITIVVHSSSDTLMASMLNERIVMNRYELKGGEGLANSAEWKPPVRYRELPSYNAIRTGQLGRVEAACTLQRTAQL
jgi:hypothetical protein